MNFLILLLFALAVSVLSQSNESSAGDNTSSENAKLEHVVTLDEQCNSAGECRNFNFPNTSSIAYFDIKPKVRILDDSTYVIREKIQFDVLVFRNSTFAHFPLNIFASVGVRELDMRNCAVETLTWDNFLGADNLRVLLLSQNKLRYITEKTFNFAPELQFLFLDDNRLRTLAGATFEGLNQLRYLDLSNNRLRELPGMLFSYIPQLQELQLSGNHLHYLPNEIFSRNPNLMSVTMRDNELRTLDEYLFKHQPNLLLFDVSNNAHLPRLIMNIRAKYLNAANCSLYLVNLYGQVENVDLRDNQIGELYFAEPKTLEKLVLRNNALQQIASLAGASQLRDLDIADNPSLEYLPDPWTVNSLERLDLSNTSLKALPISNLAEQTNLRSLNVSNNKLTEINPINFKYLEQLKHFDIAGNDWNCYNLRLLMDLLIKPKSMIYKHETLDPDFPGEYIEDIACMYRLDNSDEELNVASSEQQSINAQLNQQSKPDETTEEFEGTNEYPSEGDTNEQRLQREVISLRKELKAIVNFYESKFDVVFTTLDNLNRRVAAFERMNETMFQHITITT